MSKIELLVFFHILGAFLICGGAGVGMAAGMAMGRTTSVRAIGLLSITAHRAAFIVTLPGALLTLVTGSWLIADYRFFELDEFWLWSSYVLWVVSAGLDHGVLGPHLSRLHSMAKNLEQANTTDSEDLQKLANSPKSSITGMVLLVILIAFLGLMVFRPGESGSGRSSEASANISSEELANHDKSSDCWVAVDGLVYDLTDLIPDHSGSPDVLIPLCGKDATSAFEDKGGQGRPHSERAEGILAGYQIGRLDE